MFSKLLFVYKQGEYTTSFFLIQTKSLFQSIVADFVVGVPYTNQNKYNFDGDNAAAN